MKKKPHIQKMELPMGYWCVYTDWSEIIYPTFQEACKAARLIWEVRA